MWQNSFKDEIKKIAGKESVLTFPEKLFLTGGGTAAIADLVFDPLGKDIERLRKDIKKLKK